MEEGAGMTTIQASLPRGPWPQPTMTLPSSEIPVASDSREKPHYGEPEASSEVAQLFYGGFRRALRLGSDEAGNNRNHHVFAYAVDPSRGGRSDGRGTANRALLLRVAEEAAVFQVAL